MPISVLTELFILCFCLSFFILFYLCNFLLILRQGIEFGKLNRSEVVFGESVDLIDSGDLSCEGLLIGFLKHDELSEIFHGLKLEVLLLILFGGRNQVAESFNNLLSDFSPHDQYDFPSLNL